MASKAADKPEEKPEDTTTDAPAAKADITHADIVEDPQADTLAADPPAVPTGDPTVPRADSHDPRPAPDGQ